VEPWDRRSVHGMHECNLMSGRGGGRAQHLWHRVAMPLMAFYMHYLVCGNRGWPLLSKGCVNKGGCAASAAVRGLMLVTQPCAAG
jgi:hypothetical protein